MKVTLKMLKRIIREELALASSRIDEVKPPKKQTVSRFVCPKHGTYLKPAFVKGTRQRFYGCTEWKNDNCDFTVEGEPPYKAYGNVARDFDQHGVPQEKQDVPSARMAVHTDKVEKYHDLLRMNHDAVSDVRKIRTLLPQVHAMGGKWKKLSIDDIRNDLYQITKLRPGQELTRFSADMDV